MNNRYNVWCKWHPLKTVMLGNFYDARFFRDIKNSKTRSALTRIADETLEDLSNFEKVLKDFGCNVLRPEIDANANIMDHVQDGGKVSFSHGNSQGIPRSPLQPRDCQFVLGNQLYITSIDVKPIRQKLLAYNKTDVTVFNLNNRPQAPSCTVVGRDLYIDTHEHDSISKDELSDKISKNFFPANVRVNHLNIGGHNDACFHTLKPGVILSLNEIQHYEKTFPGWDVCYLPNQSWNLMDGFMSMKYKVRGKWWVPGEESNDEFIDFVETWLNDWVGYCEESVFDVNVLMLDEHHVCVNNHNETAFAFFKKHKIEPIIVPWRHRYFWDGGLHCITLDLYREGKMEDYFPTRSGPVIDVGFD